MVATLAFSLRRSGSWNARAMGKRNLQQYAEITPDEFI